MKIFKPTLLLAILILSCSQSVTAQDFDIQTSVEGTSALSLQQISEPVIFAKETWMNWTVHLEVLDWNSAWNTSSSLAHPSLRVLVRSPSVNFSEFHNVSFGLNRTQEWFSFSMTFIHSLHVFTTFDLGNLSGVVEQTLIVAVYFKNDMPSTIYELEIAIYDPWATTTTSTPPSTTTPPSSTTTTSTMTEITTTSTTNNFHTFPVSLEQISIPLLAISGIIVILVIWRRSK